MYFSVEQQPLGGDYVYFDAVSGRVVDPQEVTRRRREAQPEADALVSERPPAGWRGRGKDAVVSLVVYDRASLLVRGLVGAEAPGRLSPLRRPMTADPFVWAGVKCQSRAPQARVFP